MIERQLKWKMGQDLNRHFSKEDTQTANKHVKTLPIIRGVSVKTTVGHYSPVTVRAVTKTDHDKNWGGYVEAGALIHCWWGSKMMQPLWEMACHFHKWLSIDLPCDPTIPLLQEKWKRMFTPKLHMNARSSIMHNRHKLKQPTNVKWWINQVWHIHSMEHCSVMKRNEVLMCSQMDEPWKQWQKSVTKGYTMSDSTYKRNPEWADV